MKNPNPGSALERKAPGMGGSAAETYSGTSPTWNAFSWAKTSETASKSPDVADRTHQDRDSIDDS
jgi:hypothetical protein